MNLVSYFGLSHLRKFDVLDSPKMSISQKLAEIVRVRTRAPMATSRFSRITEIEAIRDRGGCAPWLR
jgi:hypothetical protein